MTEDQIKAIAEAYGETKGNGKSKTVREYNYGLMMEMLHWLSVNGYCIVEREKVIKEYNLSKKNIEKYDYSDVVRHANYGALSIMKQLFGTSMFNQDEE